MTAETGRLIKDPALRAVGWEKKDGLGIANLKKILKERKKGNASRGKEHSY